MTHWRSTSLQAAAVTPWAITKNKRAPNECFVKRLTVDILASSIGLSREVGAEVEHTSLRDIVALIYGK